MRIGVLGGRPAGLYFALLAKRADPCLQITVVERNAPDATFGWGVVFSEETLGALRDADYREAMWRSPTPSPAGAPSTWSTAAASSAPAGTCSRPSPAGGCWRSCGRCREVEVELVFQREVPDLDVFTDRDLVVAADEVQLHRPAAAGAPAAPDPGRAPIEVHLFGSDLPGRLHVRLPHDPGMFQVHAYPFDADTSTFIVEYTDGPAPAGLDQAGESESIAFCQELFAPGWAATSCCPTGRCGSASSPSAARAGTTATWSCSATPPRPTSPSGRGDQAGHGGRGRPRPGPPAPPGRPGGGLHRLRAGAPAGGRALPGGGRDSATWFENVRRYDGFDPVQFACNLLTRSGRIGHLELTRRDPAFAADVDRRFAGRTTSCWPRRRCSRRWASG